MQLTVLGTATPYPRPGNACSGYLLQSKIGENTTSLWLDAGTGTLAELQRHLALTDLDAIFVSHRHADHTADLLVAYYALRFSALRPHGRIRVFGPEALVDRLAEFLGPDALPALHEVFEFVELSGWGEAVVGDLALSWGPVAHGVPAFALTVVGPAAPGPVASGAAPGPAASGATRSPASGAAPGPADGTSTFTYSGDTAPCISLVEMAEQSSVLLCEVGYARDALGVAAVHHTPEDAGRTATVAGVDTVILTHLADDLDAADALRRTRAHFAGQIVLAEPGAAYPL
ncbi:MBL fold metallo-hydrolase [Subtercola sp. YIM 133946]|uniref:MBL fold metallo-hydrolase n=1 Tax=Subtercola sp. YIM 133946 TaxID=3118909 RepID=UPI002F945A45